jgi:hypothetical protein
MEDQKDNEYMVESETTYVIIVITNILEILKSTIKKFEEHVPNTLLINDTTEIYFKII